MHMIDGEKKAESVGGKMKVIFYDVEHGSCCHIITPNNTHILVDVGSKTNSSIVKHINKKYFSGYGGRIDELIITHPHEDHIYDLPNLYNILQPRVINRPTGAFDVVPSFNTPTHVAIANAARVFHLMGSVSAASRMASTCSGWK